MTTTNTELFAAPAALAVADIDGQVRECVMFPRDIIDQARETANDALGYVQAGQSDPPLYRMLLELRDLLDFRNADV